MLATHPKLTVSTERASLASVAATTTSLTRIEQNTTRSSDRSIASPTCAASSRTRITCELTRKLCIITGRDETKCGLAWVFWNSILNSRRQTKAGGVEKKRDFKERCKRIDEQQRIASQRAGHDKADASKSRMDEYLAMAKASSKTTKRRNMLLTNPGKENIQQQLLNHYS